MTLNRTHDGSRHSFVASANEPLTDFPLQNLPLGAFSYGGSDATRCGARIGDDVLDLRRAAAAGLLAACGEPVARAIAAENLAPLMALGNASAGALRARLFELLSEGNAGCAEVTACLVPVTDVRMALPLEPRNFTDFLTSSFHKMRMSPTGTLDPNFLSLPLAYHSRASSIRLSGNDVIRPHVQQARGGSVSFEPTRELDYELELGAFIGPGTNLGQPLSIDEAPAQLFGYCLLNDWSVRDIQRWESVPLGPFLAKSLSTTISPWVVTDEALRPFRTAAFPREMGQPPALNYLASETDATAGGFDIVLEVWLQTTQMREAGAAATRLTASNVRDLYWTFAQMVTHHASNGCNLLSGDLLGSGTVSGPDPDSRACLAELTVRGTAPVVLPNGESRSWLEDGDEVILRGRASRNGFASIGFGECRGRIRQSVTWPGANHIHAKKTEALI